MDGSTVSSVSRAEVLIAEIEESTRRADSEPDRAADLAKRALDEAGRSNDRRAKAWGLHLRGWSNFQHGLTSEALADQLAAIELFRETDDQLGLGRALAACAPIHDVAGEGAMALSYLEQALDLQRRIGDRWGEARTLNGIGIVLSQDDDHSEEGLRTFERAASIYEQLGDRRWVGFARLNAAQTSLERVRSGTVTPGDHAAVAGEAMIVAQEVVELADGLGDEGTVLGALAQTIVAGALLELGWPLDALDTAERVLDLDDSNLAQSSRVDLLTIAARAKTLTRNPRGALSMLEEAEHLAHDIKHYRLLATVLEQKAATLETLDRPREALESFRQFHELDARAKSEANMARASAVSALLDVQRSEHDLAMAKIRLDDLESAAQERSRLVAAVSHELRSPITSILGLAASVADDWDELGGDAHELVGLIRDEAQDLADMVDDLLTVSRVSSGAMNVHPEPIDLGELANELAERMGTDAASIPVSGTARVVADPGRLRQIVRNLLSNAGRYGGPEVRIECRQDGPVGVIEVCDNGSPLPLEDRERIFEPFGQSSARVRHAQSSGLGLWVARELARRMGGDLEYDHTGTESVFRLTAPSAR